MSAFAWESLNYRLLPGHPRVWVSEMIPVSSYGKRPHQWNHEDARLKAAAATKPTPTARAAAKTTADVSGLIAALGGQFWICFFAELA
jgi:hypothetical protein